MTLQVCFRSIGGNKRSIATWESSANACRGFTTRRGHRRKLLRRIEVCRRGQVCGRAVFARSIGAAAARRKSRPVAHQSRNKHRSAFSRANGRWNNRSVRSREHAEAAFQLRRVASMMMSTELAIPESLGDGDACDDRDF